jgi:hypothetical protein
VLAKVGANAFRHGPVGQRRIQNEIGSEQVDLANSSILLECEKLDETRLAERLPGSSLVPAVVIRASHCQLGAPLSFL